MPESRRPPLPGEYTTGLTDNLDAPHSTTETPAPSDSATALQRQGTRTSTPTSQSSEMKKTWKERFGLLESKSAKMPAEGSSESSQTGLFGHLRTHRTKNTGSKKPGLTPPQEELSTDRGEEAVMAYHRFPSAPNPDEVPQPDEFYSQQQHDWAIMDTWHQANRLPPLKDGEILEFDLQYPDSPTIPGYPDLSIATGHSNVTTRGSADPDPSDISDRDPRDTSGSDPYDSWVTDNERHNPVPLRTELDSHYDSPYNECHGELCRRLQAIAEDRRRDWETPEPLVPYVRWTLGEYGEEPELARFFFDNPIHSEWDVLYRRFQEFTRGIRNMNRALARRGGTHVPEGQEFPILPNRWYPWEHTQYTNYRYWLASSDTKESTPFPRATPELYNDGGEARSQLLGGMPEEGPEAPHGEGWADPPPEVPKDQSQHARKPQPSQPLPPPPPPPSPPYDPHHDYDL
ncbi:uncharacterized protein EV420DRAFT_1653067 [Desarmillaria tabescens]|uniref:Uncharacterized protein n=1 Tax=Armillaria tabescens TaxID=1929756 RepID=A0AA39J3S3_ARMTA|nr:uncharacterized protein EV420DRAFT_1653067 [Desarmillaria tabescens]KAK0435595.1 hypothetical protein EV420DRAFT_1653067 [Desarmillaria tabescens]